LSTYTWMSILRFLMILILCFHFFIKMQPNRYRWRIWKFLDEWDTHQWSRRKKHRYLNAAWHLNPFLFMPNPSPYADCQRKRELGINPLGHLHQMSMAWREQYI
jgi:hypothetical protein